MKKFRKAVALTLGIAMCIPLAACGAGGDNGGVKLTAPELSLSGNYAYWSIIDDADSYGVYIADRHVTDVTSVRYSLASLAPGSYKVEVTAKYGGKESKKSNAVTYVKAQAPSGEKPAYVYSELQNGAYDYSGLLKTVTDIAVDRQLYDEKLWETFVDQFRDKSDIDGGFRGEFWGKHMIGACLIYDQTKDEKLYKILEATVKDMLTTQADDGRISSYGRLSENEREFSDWDVWSRKYVFMGMEYFYDICKDEKLKAELADSMLGQLDYIMKYVGDGKELNINDTGINFKGLASSSILEAIVKLYTITGEQRVLDFATYIIDNGGTAITNLIDRAVENTALPYQWGAPKGYEHTSFFEGVLDYYMVTGNTRLLKAVTNYAYALLNSEIVVTGGAGYHSEQFNHATVEQANPENDEANLETCVTVTILRYLYKSYLLTGDTVFLDAFEKNFYNQMVGAVDTENNFPHPFSSYFNLMFAPKFRASGGGISINSNYIHAYGCCIAYGATGIGMIHKAAQTATDTGFNVNLYLNGTVTANLPSGSAVSLTTQTNYPNSSTVKITVGAQKAENFDINLRIPEWSESTSVSINGKRISGASAGGYCTLSREWKNGDEIILSLDMRATLFYGSEECSNPNAKYNVAVLKGPIVLARDARLGENIFQTVDIATDANGKVVLEADNTADFNTICEYKVKLKDDSYIHMIDYASAGKTYDEASLLTVFMPTTDYWKTDTAVEGGIALVNAANLSVALIEDGELTAGDHYYNYDDLSECKLYFTSRGDGYYSLSFGNGDKVLTAGADGKITEKPYTGSDRQLFSVKKCSLYNNKIVCKHNGQLISGGGPNGIVWMYPEVDSNVQHWKFIKA